MVGRELVEEEEGVVVLDGNDGGLEKPGYLFVLEGVAAVGEEDSTLVEEVVVAVVAGNRLVDKDSLARIHIRTSWLLQGGNKTKTMNTPGDFLFQIRENLVYWLNFFFENQTP